MELESTGLETLAPWKAEAGSSNPHPPVRLQNEFKARKSNFESLYFKIKAGWEVGIG